MTDRGAGLDRDTYSTGVDIAPIDLTRLHCGPFLMNLLHLHYLDCRQGCSRDRARAHFDVILGLNLHSIFRCY